MTHKKKMLRRSTKKRILGGIFGGLGEFFDIDPVILRLAFVFISVFTGFVPGIAFYFIALAIVPRGEE